jgi:protoporphyrinogen IX oxidase
MIDRRQRMLRAAVALMATAALVAVLFVWQPSGLYLWFKALHVVAGIAWMAGMLYLPRLFVYHCEAEPGSRQSETFKVMERRLLTAIINPAMITAWAVGLWLAYDGGWLRSGWFHGKLALVIALSGLHGCYTSWVHAFAADANRHGHKFYRIINEVPTVLMVGIVVLVIVKPF